MASRITEALLAEIHRYLNDEMNPLERKRFEEKIIHDLELKEELLLDKQLREVLRQDTDYAIMERNLNHAELKKIKSKLRSEEYQHLSKTITTIGKEYLEETKATKPNKMWYVYASVAAVIIFCFGLYFSQLDSSLNSLYQDNVNWTTLPSFLEKGSEETFFAQGETAYRASNYEEAISMFSQIKPTDDLYVISLQYLGASYDLTNQNEKAIATFNKLSQIGNSYEHSKAYWYLTLVYLKMEKKENAIESLKNIRKDSTNYKYEEAQKLLLKLQ